MKYIEYNNMITQRGEDGFFKLHYDQIAIDEFWHAEIQPKLWKFENYIIRMKQLHDQGYYIDFLEMYTESNILEIEELIYSKKFKFASFMAINKFFTDYALKSFDGTRIVERYEDRIIATALYLGQGNIDKAKSLALSMIEQRYQPATPTFLNSGRAARGELISCFLLEMDDSLNSINYNLSTAMQLSKIGGGVALNLSKLRGRGAAIKGFEGAASGVIPVMKLLEDAFNYANQLGQRKGAGAVYLNIFHWDLIEFLDTKKINADEKSRIQTLSLGLIVPDKFIELAKDNKTMQLFEPKTVFDAYGKHLDDIDIDVMYEELIVNPKVKKKEISPRKLLQRIAQTQFESGYPYMMYKSTANKHNPLKGIGQIKMSNLCTEIFQVQTTSQINDYGKEDNIGYDINCNLGSLNIVNVMENKNIQETVHTAMEALTAVSDLSKVENAPGIQKANNEFHSVGLGAMNLHGFYAKNLIQFESPEAIDFASTFFAAVNYYSLEKSMLIAKETGKKFTGFDKSEYANGNYFDKYLTTEYTPESAKVKELFNGIQVPTIEDWQSLKANVQKYGVYNSYRMAIAPTQSISYVQNATASIQPVVDLIEKRTYGNSTTYYQMPYLSKESQWFYKAAYNINQMKMIDLYAKIQEHVDQGLSTILFVTNETNTSELVKYYMYAHAKGLKSLYYTRTKNLTVEECITCSV